MSDSGVKQSNFKLQKQNKKAGMMYSLCANQYIIWFFSTTGQYKEWFKKEIKKEKEKNKVMFLPDRSHPPTENDKKNDNIKSK